MSERGVDRAASCSLGQKSSLEPRSQVLLPPKPRPLASPTISGKPQSWNTRSLPWRFASDMCGAVCASALVAPVITIIDRSIIERASSRETFRSSILKSTKDLLARPHLFLGSRPFLLISAVYSSTYFTANTIDTLHSTISNDRPETTTSGPSKFIGTSIVNMSLCLYKDSQFARMFGPSSPAVASAVPLVSYALFACRDSMTIFASFNLPPLVGPSLPMSSEMEKHVSRTSAAQFLIPAGMQLLSTPLHLLGLDLYNRPSRQEITWRARLDRVGRDWLGSSFARMGRIIPAFGVGGVVNAKVRARMMGMCKD